MSSEQKVEIVNRAKRVVSEVQVKKLNDLIKLLAEDIFTDKQQMYFIVIDRLDEDWADDRVRFKLIKALIESVREFRKIRTVKIVIALRTDLLEHVLERTTSAGFQGEKYEAMYLRIKWTKDQIRELLDRRVNFVFKRQYTRERIGVEDILPPNQIAKMSALDYMLQRTFMRPREAILFVNECIERSDGRARISIQTLRAAEVTYSEGRLRSLGDEWRINYPRLLDYVRILEGRQGTFCVNSIGEHESENFALGLLEKGNAENDPVVKLADSCYMGNLLDWGEFLLSVFRVLYHVGSVGVKTDPHISYHWSYIDVPEISKAQFRPDMQMTVHPAFWAALGITSRRFQSAESAAS